MAKSTGLPCGWIIMLMILALGRGDACSFESSDELCTAVLTPLVLSSLPATGAQTSGPSGTCDFITSDCGYQQGCLQPGAPEWKKETGAEDGISWGRFEMKANVVGYYGNSSVLESPELNVASVSCLNYKAVVFNPVQMAVLASAGGSNCTLQAAYTKSDDEIKNYEIELPRGIDRIMFRGVHGGDKIGFAHIEHVSVRTGCCKTQEEWSVIHNGEEFSNNLLDCSWTNSNWSIESGTAEPRVGQGTAELTSPLIQATSSTDIPGLCVSFEYVLPNGGGQSSLSVSLVDPQNVPRTLWSDTNANESTSGENVFLMGRVLVSSGTAFKIRFTGMTAVTPSSGIKFTNVTFSWGGNSQCQLSLLKADADSESGASAAVTGVVITSLLLCLAVVIGGFILRKKRKYSPDPDSSATKGPKASAGAASTAVYTVCQNSKTPEGNYDDPNLYFEIEKDGGMGGFAVNDTDDYNTLGATIGSQKEAAGPANIYDHVGMGNKETEYDVAQVGKRKQKVIDSEYSHLQP